MRAKTEYQSSIFELFSEHNIGQELSAISKIIDENPKLVDLIANDLGGHASLGRKGFTADQVFRFSFLKQYSGFSYRELEFYLEDSLSFQAFSRTWKHAPKRAVLQKLISSISAETWERVNRNLIAIAKEKGIENGQMTRTDSTVTETHIHPPSDSTLIQDCVHVMVRLLEKGQKISGFTQWSRHTKAVSRLVKKITFQCRKASRKRYYQRLIEYANKTFSYLCNMSKHMKLKGFSSPKWNHQAAEALESTVCVLDQTHRRVIEGEKVPSEEKLVSIFEDHTDIIIKGRRDVQFGHKINVTTGKSNLFIDVFIEEGNPCDTTTAQRMVERQKEIYGAAPRQVAFDGGYASKDNLMKIKSLGVKDVAFHKKKGIQVEDMCSSPGVYRKLKAFRATIEANIAHIKNKFNLSRCNWKGFKRFRSFVWSATVACNLTTMSRLI